MQLPFVHSFFSQSMMTLTPAPDLAISKALRVSSSVKLCVIIGFTSILPEANMATAVGHLWKKKIMPAQANTNIHNRYFDSNQLAPTIQRMTGWESLSFFFSGFPSYTAETWQRGHMACTEVHNDISKPIHMPSLSPPKKQLSNIGQLALVARKLTWQSEQWMCGKDWQRRRVSPRDSRRGHLL